MPKRCKEIPCIVLPTEYLEHQGACFLLRELDAVADPCCELNVGNVLNPVEGL